MVYDGESVSEARRQFRLCMAKSKTAGSSSAGESVRPKIVDAIWTLYLSPEFVDEVIGGNKQMERAHRQAGGNRGENRLLPGFQDEPSRGK